MFSESWWNYSISKVKPILKSQEKQQDLSRTVKRESKRDQDTMIYPGSPFLKGYVQSLTSQ